MNTHEALFQLSVKVNGTFDIFNVTCKQKHRTTSNPFLNVQKDVYVEEKSEQDLRSC